jgi:hypothetical protein
MTAMRRLAARLGYLWDGMDPDGVELLSAALSFSFGVLLLRAGRSDLFPPAWAYACLCLTSASLKVYGVLREVGWARVLGLCLGIVFWTALAYILLRRGNSIAWLSYAVLVLAQLWAVRRVVMGGRRG